VARRAGGSREGHVPEVIVDLDREAALVSLKVALGRAFAVFLSLAVPASAAVIESPHPAAAAVIASSLTAVRFSQPPERSALREGEIVEIRWSGVPGNADEIELLLSVDGGQHFSLRLTDELNSGSRSFLWRVPGLLTDSASLAIRVGIHGREILSAPGPLFRLSRNPWTASVSLRWKAGEIWVDSGDPGETAGRNMPSPSDLSTRPERITSVPDDSDAADLPHFSNARPAASACGMRKSALREADGHVLVGSPSRAPLSIPRRI
jgi:hypothetical protein